MFDLILNIYLYGLPVAFVLSIILIILSHNYNYKTDIIYRVAISQAGIDITKFVKKVIIITIFWPISIVYAAITIFLALTTIFMKG